MASSSAEGDPAPKDVECRPERKRKRVDASSPLEAATWRTDAEEKSYSSKLLEALRRVRRASSPTGGTAVHRSRAVREAADRVLAATARGRARWSRAILASRTIKLRARRCHRRRRLDIPSLFVTAGAASARATERRKPPALEKKARVLGRLVPGCGKLSFPTLLEEASDYIAALQMQVRALSAIADALSAGTAAWPSVAAGSPPPEPM